MLTTFLAEMWLTRTHFIQYWKYQGVVIFVADEEEEGEGDGEDRAISDCHFSVQLNHFIPGFLSYSVPVSLK